MADDQALLALVRAVASGDAGSASASTARHPDLARGARVTGVTQDGGVLRSSGASGGSRTLTPEGTGT